MEVLLIGKKILPYTMVTIAGESWHSLKVTVPKTEYGTSTRRNSM